MKKLIFSCAVAITMATTFTSCDTETCYTCEAIVSAGCTLDVCGGIATSSGTACQVAATAANAAYSNSDDIKGYLETVGYTCTKK